MLDLLELLATLCAALFAGASLYINLVEHPARMSLGPAAALAEWAPSYHRAAVMQGSLAIIGTLAAVVTWATGSGAGWLVGALLLGAVVPVTLFVIFPVNRQLLDPAAPGDLDRTAVLLAQWNRLHAIRTVLGLAALATFLVLIASGER